MTLGFKIWPTGTRPKADYTQQGNPGAFLAQRGQFLVTITIAVMVRFSSVCTLNLPVSSNQGGGRIAQAIPLPNIYPGLCHCSIKLFVAFSPFQRSIRTFPCWLSIQEKVPAPFAPEDNLLRTQRIQTRIPEAVLNVIRKSANKQFSPRTDVHHQDHALRLVHGKEAAT